MTDSSVQIERTTINQHADMFRANYPELHKYLVRRDRLLHRILLRFPDPADPEAGAGGVDFAGLVEELKALPPGVGDLGREQHTYSEMTRTIDGATPDR